MGCSESAVSTYLDARDAKLLEFGVCAGHFARMQSGDRPEVVTEHGGLRDLRSRPALILKPNEPTP